MSAINNDDARHDGEPRNTKVGVRLGLMEQSNNRKTSKLNRNSFYLTLPTTDLSPLILTELRLQSRPHVVAVHCCQALTLLGNKIIVISGVPVVLTNFRASLAKFSPLVCRRLPPFQITTI